MRRTETAEVRRAKRALTRALGRQETERRYWSCASGHPHYDNVRSFVDHEKSSVEVKAATTALRSLGIRPSVDDTLYHERFPMWPGWADKMFAAARERGLIKS